MYPSLHPRQLALLNARAILSPRQGVQVLSALG
jgi:hypothetical protein